MPLLHPAPHATGPQASSRHRVARAWPAAAAAVVLLAPAVAAAHAGHAPSAGFVAGALHPLGGLDHVLAMLAVGLFAALPRGTERTSGAGFWLLPASFLAAMVAGAGLGLIGVALPLVEPAIALSVVLLGLAIALRLNLPIPAAMAAVGLFALFHGHAHGAALPAGGSALAFGAGFALATAALLGTGLCLGHAIGRAGRHRMVAGHRLGGSAIAMAGLALVGMV